MTCLVNCQTSIIIVIIIIMIIISSSRSSSGSSSSVIGMHAYFKCIRSYTYSKTQ